MPTDNPNPGNFANRPKEEVREIASKGGRSGTENKGFASENYPEEKQVSTELPVPSSQFPISTPHFSPPHLRSPSARPTSLLTILQREVASKGGKASSGSFQPGDERARQAGRKGGSSGSNGSNATDDMEYEDDELEE